MSRLHTVFAIVLFGSAYSQADDGRSRSVWPQAQPTVVAQADPWQTGQVAPPAPPAPPSRHTLPTPPTPPTPPHHAGHGHGSGNGISVSIHGNKVEIDGIKDMIDGHIQTALDMVRSNKNIPADVRAKLEKKLEKLKDKLQKRFSKLDISDLDDLGDELGKMGDEIGEEMEDFGKEMEKYGKTFDNKNFGKNWNFSHRGHDNSHDSDDDNDDDDDKVTSVDIDNDQDDPDVELVVGDLSLNAPQRDAIQKLRADSDKQVATAKRALDQASNTLKKQLENMGSSDAEISRAIDAVTQQEAQIRKARILAWHNARRVLDDAQRRKVENAVKRPK